jgi:isoleucyl-tRNA synthetase
MTDLENHYSPTDVESNVKKFWEQSDVYEQVKSQNSGNEQFCFVDGPPFTSGRMHCGTAWGKVLKDVFLRYYRMNGYDVRARPGYDTHGLPIEVKVEEENGFDSKQDIEEYGVERFISECQDYAYEQKSVMDEEFSDLGVWMDWDNPYLTMSKDYMNTVWSAFYQLHRDGLISRKFDVLNNCPRCETTLSDSELEYDYRNVEAAYVGFDLQDQDAKLVTWTTTPWTVTGHQFVAVDKDSTYARVSTGSEDYYVEESCVGDAMEMFGNDNFNVVSEVKGEKLVGMLYNHPLKEYVDGLPDMDYRVEHADYVQSDKTGLVHSAPGFGHEDYERGSELGLHPFSPVREDGCFSSDAGDRFAGNYVHTEGTEEALSVLDNVGALLATEEYNHEYPHCPRCDTDVVFRATKQWMVEVTNMKEELLDVLEDTNWYPSEARDERFKNTIENAPNWNISRQRYWGTPLPVWVCEFCESDTVVNSSEHLYELSKGLENPPEDLHRPSVDNVVVECDKCGSDMHRVEDVLDVWFDSSVASWGSADSLPHKSSDPDGWPSDLIVEGHDQTRGWFLMQLYMGVALTDKAPYQDVLMHGFAMLDGKPMSKSAGHVLRPPEVIEEHGRDALRTYMLSNEQQENDVNMTSDMKGVSNMKQKLDIVWNVYRFALMYMDADDYELNSDVSTSAEDRRTLDNWVLSRLDSTVEKSNKAFENRQPHQALLSTLEFLVEDVSRYYIKTIRDRVWTEEDTKDKECVYDTLGTVLHSGAKLLAPFAPYLAEKLYDSLPTSESEFTVHSAGWPDVRGNRDKSLEDSVENLRELEKSTARGRDKLGRKQRWGVKTVYVETSEDELENTISKYRNLLKDRTNVREFKLVEEFGQKKQVVNPDMGKLGPKYKQDAEAVGNKVRGTEYSNLPAVVEVGDNKYEVTEEDVDMVQVLPDGFETVERDNYKLYLVEDTTEEMVEDGLVRDLVRRCQEMRSEMGLNMEDYVEMKFQTNSEKLKSAFDARRDYISNEVRVVRYSSGETSMDYTIQDNVDKYEATIGLSKT